MRSCSATESDPVVKDLAAGVSGGIAFLGAFPLFALIYLGIGIKHFVEHPNSSKGIMELLMGIFLAVLMLYLGYCTINQSGSRYSVQEDGLLIQWYLKKNPELIPWEKFQQVCICYADVSAAGKNTVICCVRHGEKRKLNGRWKTDNVFHYKGVIRIAYSDERLEEFEAICPMPIADLRRR